MVNLGWAATYRILLWPDTVLAWLHNLCKWHPLRSIWNLVLGKIRDSKQHIWGHMFWSKREFSHVNECCVVYILDQRKSAGQFICKCRWAIWSKLMRIGSDESVRVSLQILNHMQSEGDHLSPGDHTENALLKLASWVSESSFVEVCCKGSKEELYRWMQRLTSILGLLQTKSRINNAT